MILERWRKKDVELTWRGQRLPLAVAQELFSSHDVDAGSKLLLRSLDPDQFPAAGTAIDFGCGYGVLGLAWAQAKPDWAVTMIDRDALAVAFAATNASQTGLTQATAVVGLGVDAAPVTGVDLILWNVPGKAGETVLTGLTGDVARALGQNGVAALVVVNPLAQVIRDALANDADMEVMVDETNADHTVIHARRTAATAVVGDPFEAGVFDREEAGFGVDDFDYDITPVIGIPEYDSYSFATQVTFDLLRTVDGEPASILVFRPGQGHVPIVASHMFDPRRLVIADRDWLAVRASLRAVADAGLRIPAVDGVAVVDLLECAGEEGCDLVILNLEEQVRNDLHVARLEDLQHMVPVGGQLVIGGTSSTVSRFLSLAAKTRDWRQRDRSKRSGASAARLERMA